MKGYPQGGITASCSAALTLTLSEETERIAAADFTRQRDLKESTVVHRIRAGIYPGTYENGAWYVLRGPSHLALSVGRVLWKIRNSVGRLWNARRLLPNPPFSRYV